MSCLANERQLRSARPTNAGLRMASASSRTTLSSTGSPVGPAAGENQEGVCCVVALPSRFREHWTDFFAKQFLTSFTVLRFKCMRGRTSLYPKRFSTTSHDKATA
eukprot:5976274-Pyramimonas_sp.AAC.1